ncbi:MAG TPA: PQQ-binding-like beta-propeller repeat protein [Verrucomicrobiota bacterium]|nr:PQQ-binding-like beta-propeller repeat protein [Verrucomicrobiota bacterium]HRZ36100.1 PQQ-binding-like beta-propeller repeat protein [Candidatus Paceibacterota bacterium]HRZ54495.1 PQQ-binding-like beta-propeller repeat protein [Candidatus Paceibacterota bacterium]
MLNLRDPNRDRPQSSPGLRSCRGPALVTRSLLLLSALCVVSSLAAVNWPELRGPLRNGHALDANPPLSWSETNHIVWKTAIHDLGWSSPVVWGKQIWLTTATTNGREMYAVCVDAETGRVVLDVKVFDTPEPEYISSINSYASPTSAIEADRVYVHYGTYGTACLGTQNGKVLWSRRDLNCDHHEGPGASLMLDGDRLYVPVDGRDVQYVVALDKATGRTVWKTNRSIDYSQFTSNCRKAFCTPIVIEAGGRRQLFSPGAKAMFAYDPDTGAELWKARYNGWSMVPRPLFGHGLLYVITDYERPELWAVRPDGEGDVTDTHVAWKVVKDMPSTASLLLIEDLLYMVNDQGFALCVEAKTGTVVWRERIGGKHSASPIYTPDRIYFFNERNRATVIAPGREFRVLAESQLDDPLMASPAVTGDALILRSRTHLYRIQ